MIFSFPVIYPDEIFYSAFSRYLERMGYPNNKAVLNNLLGKYSGIKTTLPSNLNRFVDQLPFDNGITVKKIIQENTLFPYYGPFLSERMYQSLYEDMAGDRIRQTSIAVARYRPVGILKEGYLRYCPLCFDEDISDYGESYWHRKHQLPGVDVCLKHECFIEVTAFPSNKNATGVFYTASMIKSKKNPKRLNLKSNSFRFLLKIANEFDWLLDQKNLFIGNKALREKYKIELVRNGYLNQDGTVHVERFLTDFVQFYSMDFLKSIRCPINSVYSSRNWLINLSNPHPFSANPIFHSLMILFIADNFKNFLT